MHSSRNIVALGETGNSETVWRHCRSVGGGQLAQVGRGQSSTRHVLVSQGVISSLLAQRGYAVGELCHALGIGHGANIGLEGVQRRLEIATRGEQPPDVGKLRLKLDRRGKVIGARSWRDLRRRDAERGAVGLAKVG